LRLNIPLFFPDHRFPFQFWPRRLVPGGLVCQPAPDGKHQLRPPRLQLPRPRRVIPLWTHGQFRVGTHGGREEVPGGGESGYTLCLKITLQR
jgi:hypothetical protein